MKVLKFDKKNNFIKIKLDNLDDLWVLSRIIGKNDIIGSQTTRIIKKTEGKEGKRKPMFIKIEVEKVEFAKNILKLLGKITESSNPDVPLGSFHSLSFEPKDVIEITKEFQQWQLQRMKDAEESAKRPKILLCAAEYGEAVVAILREFGIEYVTDLSKSLPGKRKGTEKQYESSRDEYLMELAKLIDEVSESQHIKKVAVGGVGFLIEHFTEVLNKFPNLKKKVSTVKISHTGKTGINEMIKSGVVEKIIKGSRISEETKLIEKMFEEIAKEGLATYGIAEVKKAVEYGAVDFLLVSDAYINELKEKDQFEELEKLMKDVEQTKGQVRIISDQHEAGERFAKMQVGALLRYKI